MATQPDQDEEVDPADGDHPHDCPRLPDFVGDRVVMRDVEAGSTVVASPARPLDQEGSPLPLEP